MAEIDSIDALDGPPVKASSWDSVVSHFDGQPWAEPIGRFAKAIRDCPYAGMLHPVTSMWDIRIYPTANGRFYRDCLVVRFDSAKQEFELEHFEHAHVNPRWVKRCSAEESFSAFIHLLSLKSWSAHEISRGAWTCS
jgi:hypothetical protein